MNLPPGSRLWRLLGGPASWEPMEYWAATLLDVAREANWQRTENGTKGVGHPGAIPRPEVAVRGSSRTKAEAATFDRAATFKARQAAREAAGEG